MRTLLIEKCQIQPQPNVMLKKRKQTPMETLCFKNRSCKPGRMNVLNVSKCIEGIYVPERKDDAGRIFTEVQ